MDTSTKRFRDDNHDGVPDYIEQPSTKQRTGSQFGFRAPPMNELANHKKHKLQFNTRTGRPTKYFNARSDAPEFVAPYSGVESSMGHTDNSLFEEMPSNYNDYKRNENFNEIMENGSGLSVPMKPGMTYQQWVAERRRVANQQAGFMKNAQGLVEFFGFTQIPNGMVYRMNYALHGGSSGITVNSGATPQEYRFRGDSIYDPDFTTGAGSTTAYQMDQAAAAYKDYIVLASRMRITLAAYQASNDYTQVLVSLFPQSGDATNSYSAFSITTQAQIDVMPYLVQESLWTMSFAQKFSANKCTLKHTMTSSKMFPAGTDLTNLYGLTGGSGTGSLPNNKWYWRVWFNNYGSSNRLVYMDVDIEFFTMLFERNVLSSGEGDTA